VRVLADGHDGDDSYLVMELVLGRSLKQLFRERGRRIPLLELEPVVTQILGVLAAAHARGVIHRDIKPDNILLSKDGKVKLVDFGIARVRGDNTAKTATGVVLGTPTFMAPEQALGRWSDVDGRTDLFALGATIYTSLSGAFVHEGTTVPELVISAATRQVPSLASVIDDVHPSIVHVVDRALSFHRDDRFADAVAMQSAWLDALAGRPVARPRRRTSANAAPSPPAVIETTTAPVGASIEALPAPPRTSRRAIVLAAASAVVIASAAGFGAAALFLGDGKRSKDAKKTSPATGHPPPAPSGATEAPRVAASTSARAARCSSVHDLEELSHLLEASVGADRRYIQMHSGSGYASALVVEGKEAIVYWLQPERCEIVRTSGVELRPESLSFTLAEVPWPILKRVSTRDGIDRYQRETGHEGKLTITLLSKIGGRLMLTVGVDGAGGSRTYLYERSGEPWTSWQ